MEDHTPKYTQPQLPFEEWRDIPGYEGMYQASIMGHIRSLDRLVAHGKRDYKRFKKGVVLYPELLNIGYLALRLTKDGIHVRHYIHDLVAAAFLGEKGSGWHVHHVNENKLDNRLENLTYLSAFSHLELHQEGERNHAATVTELQVLAMRARATELGIRYGTIAKIAREYSVSLSLAHRIVHRKTWQHI